MYIYYPLKSMTCFFSFFLYGAKWINKSNKILNLNSYVISTSLFWLPTMTSSTDMLSAHESISVRSYRWELKGPRLHWRTRLLLTRCWNTWEKSWISEIICPRFLFLLCSTLTTMFPSLAASLKGVRPLLLGTMSRGTGWSSSASRVNIRSMAWHAVVLLGCRTKMWSSVFPRRWDACK